MPEPAKPPASAPAPGSPAPSSGSQAPTPGTISPPAPPTNPGAGVPTEVLEQQRKLIEAQAAVIRESTQSTQRLQQELRELKEQFSRPPAAPAPTAAERDKEFWNNPSAALDKRDQSLIETLKREMRETVEPLVVNTREVKVTSAVEREKARLRKEYGDDAFKKMEPIVDQFFDKATAAGIEVSPELAEIAGTSSYGVLARSGGLAPAAPAAPASSSPPPAGDRKVDSPPYMPPSAPVIPGHESEKPGRRTLTENEERLRRERKMTVDEYLDWIDVKPEQVVHSVLGKAGK